MKSRDQERNDFRDFAKLLSKYTHRAKIRGTEKLIAEGKGMWVKKKNGEFEWCGEIISTRFHSDKVIIEFRNTLETTTEPTRTPELIAQSAAFASIVPWCRRVSAPRTRFSVLVDLLTDIAIPIAKKALHFFLCIHLRFGYSSWEVFC